MRVRELSRRLDLELIARDTALRLQAIEYERRIEGLNHENERIDKAAQLSVSNEKFDGFINAFTAWKQGVDKFINGYEGSFAAMNKSSANLRSAILIAIGMATLIISLVVALANHLIH